MTDKEYENMKNIEEKNHNKKKIFRGLLGVSAVALIVSLYTAKMGEKKVEAPNLPSSSSSVTIDKDAPILSVEYSTEELTCMDVEAIIKANETPVVNYSTKEHTNGNVVVTIKSNEPMQEINGWALSIDGKTLTKFYDINKEEQVTVSDLTGNKQKVDVRVNELEDNNNNELNLHNLEPNPYLGPSQNPEHGNGDDIINIRRYRR